MRLRYISHAAVHVAAKIRQIMTSAEMASKPVASSEKQGDVILMVDGGIILFSFLGAMVGPNPGKQSSRQVQKPKMNGKK